MNSSINDPWYKATLTYSGMGGPFDLRAPQDSFSTLQIDDGTLLLLDHLPPGNPLTVLDLGCGYGALGMPIAARYPDAQVEMVDRDLLAVRYSALNAVLNGLNNVNAHGSLGFRGVLGGVGFYDWILCNVPARIGRPFIASLIESGRVFLKPEGELRVVVIHDLAPVLFELQAERNWPLKEVVKGSRHTVFSIGAAPNHCAPSEAADLYLRDSVEIDGLKLDRPYDSGGDDPKRINLGFPILLEALSQHPPHRSPETILCFRSAYGQMPAIARKRWPAAQILTVDRDLLATEYTRRNLIKLDNAQGGLEVRENAHFPEALLAAERFDLILGELNSSAGEPVAISEVQAVERVLAPGGQAFLLCFDRPARNWIRPYAQKNRVEIQAVITRDAYTVLRIPRGR